MMMINDLSIAAYLYIYMYTYGPFSRVFYFFFKRFIVYTNVEMINR